MKTPKIIAIIGMTCGGLAYGQESSATKPTAVDSSTPVAPQGTEAPGGLSKKQDTLSVDFPGEEIRTVLRNVADLFELNLVIPETLQGTTSIKLRDVTWRQIFDVVLKPINYTYIEDHGIIKVISQEVLAAEPVTTEVFILNYSKAAEVQAVVVSLIDPAVGGKIVTDVRNNAIVITERPTKIGKIRPIIEQIDRATDQVMIESKFVETNDANISNLGIKWGSLGKEGVGLSVGPTNRSYLSNSGSKTTSDYSESNLNSNLPASYGKMDNLSGFPPGYWGPRVKQEAYVVGFRTDPTTGNQTPITGYRDVYDFGATSTDSLSFPTSLEKLTTTTMDATRFGITMHALDEMNDVKIVSNPTIVTLNNSEAMINVGEEYPIPNYTYNQQQGTYTVSGFEYKPIGIILKVTPQVNARQFIKLAIEPEVSQRQGTVNFGGAGGAELPLIQTRKTKTNVTMKDGYTLGIGGLIKTTTSQDSQKIPILGSIPVLGRLFSHKQKEKDISNLLVFITAKVINPEGSTPETILDPRQIEQAKLRRSDLPGYRAGPDPFLPEGEPVKAKK